MGFFLLCCFLLLLTNPSISWAQDRFIRPITFLEGLPTQTIYDIHQGPRGYLYLGTDVGVFQYNGQNFFKIPVPESWDNNFDNLLHDEKGNLWVKNFANQIFQLTDGELKIIPAIQEILKPLGSLKKFTIKENQVFASMDQTVLSIDLSNFEHTIIAELTSKDIMFYSLQEHEDHVYFNSSNRILDQYGQTRYQSPNNSKVLEFTFFKDQVLGLNRTLEGELFNFNTNTFLDKSNLPKGTYLYFFKEVADELFLCTNKGLFVVDIDKNRVNPSMMAGKRISDILKDREGNLWISSLDDGLYFIAQAPLYTTQLTNYKDQSRNNVLSLQLTNDQHLLAGNNKGEVFRVNPKGNIIQSYTSALQNEVEFIYFDSTGQRVFYSQGVFDYPSGDGLKARYFSKKIAPDDAGNLFMATSTGSGLIAADLSSVPSVNFEGKFPLENHGNKGIPFFMMYEKRAKTSYYSNTQQRYYLGTSENLLSISKDGQIREIRHTKEDPLIVNAIIEDDTRNIWIGTQQMGLIKIYKDSIEKLIPIVDDGVVVPVKKLIQFHDKILVIGGNQLYEYCKTEQKIRVLPISSLFKGINLNDLIIWEDKIWLATSEGLLWTTTDDYSPTPNPKIHLRQVSSNGNPVSLSEELPYNLENLEFQLDVLHFSSLGGYTVQFRTNPKQDSWQTLSKGQQNIIFAALNSGANYLEVRVIIGEVISDSLIINFSVSTPFWKTWWFISIVLISLSLGIYAYILYYGRLLKEKEAAKSRLLQSQLTAIRSQMNPHFLFNVVNAVQGLIFANQKEDASNYLGQFSNLIRKVLQLSDKQFVRLEDEISLIDLYISLEKRRFEEEFEYILDVDHRLEKNLILIPSLIIQPFVENAVKHGLLHQLGKKMLRVTFCLNDSSTHVLVTIEDNGIGREASQEINAKRKNHQAFATKAIENRVNLINESLKNPIAYTIEDLVNDAGIGIGTKITLSLPFTYEFSHTSR